MYVEVLDGSWERARGAAFRPSLEGRILVFVYPRAVRHLFHTFFCPPLRITPLDDRGHPICSLVRDSGAFVRLPASRVVLETAPEVTPAQALDVVRRRCPEVLTTSTAGSANESVFYDTTRLFFLALLDPMRELRSFKERLLNESNGIDEQQLLQSLPLWQQGRLLESAVLVVENPDVPGTTVSATSFRLARQICSLVPSGRREEIVAAGIAGGPWPDELQNPLCLKCLQACTWRRILHPHDTVPADVRWRYERPENAVPLCRRCIGTVDWNETEHRRFLGLGLWGQRFGALLQWHEAAVTGTLPSNWDRIDYPLWPKQYGGDTWPTGSGAAQHVDMRSPAEIERRRIHGICLEDVLGLSPARIRTLKQCFPTSDRVPARDETRKVEQAGSTETEDRKSTRTSVWASRVASHHARAHA